jgi:hypothetical protein
MLADGFPHSCSVGCRRDAGATGKKQRRRLGGLDKAREKEKRAAKFPSLLSGTLPVGY